MTIFTGGCQCGAVRFRVRAGSARRRSAIAACARRRSAASTPRWCRCRRAVRLDDARTEAVPIVESCDARVLRGVRDAADLRGAGRDRAGDRRLRRSGGRRTDDPVRHRGEIALYRQAARTAHAFEPRRTSRATLIWQDRVPPASGPAGCRGRNADRGTSHERALRGLYPEIEPFETRHARRRRRPPDLLGALRHPGAKPAVFLHGGPGGGCSPVHRRLFDPARLRRPALRPARLRPLDAPCLARGQHHLASRRRHRAAAAMVGAEKWLVFGGSWGSTLALAYAETHPERVSELVLRGIYTLTRPRLDWYYQFGVSEMFPGQMGAVPGADPAAERGDMMMAYRRRLVGDDPAEQLAAAKAWSIWEGETITLMPDESLTAGLLRRPFRARLRADREPLFRPCRMAGGGAAPARRAPSRGHSRRHRPRPLRHAMPGAHAWNSCQGPGRMRTFIWWRAPATPSTEPGILDRLIRATDRFAGKA